MRRSDAVDYRRLSYQWQQHHQRFRAYVKVHGLPCQSCGGAGGEVEWVCELGGPWMDCGWCEGTGLVTRWLRGQWLRFMAEEKREKIQRRAKKAEDGGVKPEAVAG